MTEVNDFDNNIILGYVKCFCFIIGSDNWLQNCFMSVSPTGEIIVIAQSNKIVVLSAKWDSNAALNQYHITFSGSLDDPSDIITSVLSLPIASQNKSSQVRYSSY